MTEESTPKTGPVLAVFAHPDDAEIAAGATMTKWVKAGREVHLLVLTNGDRGSDDPKRDRSELAATRRVETEAGAKVMGLASARVLSIHDGELENTAIVREAVVRRIRELGAETVLSCDPTTIFFKAPEGTTTYYNHSDHRTAGFVAMDSVFPGAGSPHFFSEHLGEGLDVREVHDIWLGWTNEPNHFEDVTGHFVTKMAALAKHESQLTEGIRFFEEFLEKDAVDSAKKIGTTHAEEFRVVDLS